MKPLLTALADGEADIKSCKRCGTTTFWVPVEVGLYSAAGFRMIRILVCDNDPKPTAITENPDGSYDWGF